MAETDCVAAGWTLVDIETGAMYPICVNNDCSDSLDIWRMFCHIFFFVPAPQNAGKPKCDHAIVYFAPHSLHTCLRYELSTCRARPNV